VTKVVTKGALEHGFVPEAPGLIYRRDPALGPATKVAAFDMDGTLINTKGTAEFPRDENDWKPFNKKVAAKLKELSAGGYAVVVFSNQAAIKTALTGKAAQKITARLHHFMSDERGCGGEVPYHALLATQKDGKEGSQYRKGEGTQMWQFFVDQLNGGVAPDMDESFFVGDAAGRDGDHGSNDKDFAAALGLRFELPEDFFGAMEGKKAVPVSPNAKKLLSGEVEATGPNAELLSVLIAYKDVSGHAPRAPPPGPRASGGPPCRREGAAAWPLTPLGVTSAPPPPPPPQLMGKAIKTHDKMVFKFNAMKKAIASLVTLDHRVASGKEAMKLPGIGKGTGATIDEFYATGKIVAMEELAAEVGQPITADVKASEAAAEAKNEAAFAFL